MSTEEVASVEAEDTTADVVETEEVSEAEPSDESSEVSEEVEASDEESDSVSDEVQEAAEEIQQAIDDGASEEEVQELIDTFKLKVNGKEKEVTLDWNNKEDIVRRLQLAEAAQEAMQNKAELEKTFEQEINRLRDNPWDVLKELGLDPDELAEDRIAQQIEELQKSPEQKAQEERDRELQELRDKLKKQEEEKERLEFEQMQKQAEVDLERDITEAISSTTELPKSPYVVKRVADAMAWAMDNGRPDISPKEVLPIVEKEINEELNGFLENMPDKVLEKFMSKKVTERLRKQRLAKMPSSQKKVVDTGKKPVEEKKKKLSLRDFQRKGFGD